jgi:nucleoside-diphosphate-sugar epimerase
MTTPPAQPQALALPDGPILVTGAGGFLGRHLCRLLLRLGAEVHGTVRSSPAPSGVHPHALDLIAPEAVRACVERLRPALVFHLAAPVNLSRDPQAYGTLRPGILDATHNIAQACLAHGTRLVAAGTCEEYGAQRAPFTESMQAKPVSAYSSLKLAATQWLLTLHRVAGLQATIVRPFLSYGPGQSTQRLIPAALAAALAGRALPLTDGQQTREVNWVGDTARGIAAAATPAAIGRIINIGGGPERSVLSLATTIFELAGADPALVLSGSLPRRGGEVERFFGDHRLAERLLGHRPETSLEQGLTRTIEHARKHVAQ